MQALNLHPALLRDLVHWDVLTWQQAIFFWDLHLPHSLEGMRALELGAAEGGLSLYLGLKGATVICSDLRAPGHSAQHLHRRYGLENHISYRAIDARVLPFEDQSLDLVCFKSVLGGIRKGMSEDPKPEIMREIYRVLKPGGRVLLAENLRGHRLLGWLRQVFVPWAEGWEYMAEAEILALLQPFSEVEYATSGLLALLGRNESQRRWLGQLERPFLSVVPRSWHYLFMGVARK